VITAGRGYDYLTKEVATSKHDYYTGAGEAPGQWAGRSAALLGLSGEVDADEMAVLYGRFVVPSTAGGTRLPSGRWEPEQVLGPPTHGLNPANDLVREIAGGGSSGCAALWDDIASVLCPGVRWNSSPRSWIGTAR